MPPSVFRLFQWEQREKIVEQLTYPWNILTSWLNCRDDFVTAKDNFFQLTVSSIEILPSGINHLWEHLDSLK